MNIGGGRQSVGFREQAQTVVMRAMTQHRHACEHRGDYRHGHRDSPIERVQPLLRLLAGSVESLGFDFRRAPPAKLRARLSPNQSIFGAPAASAGNHEAPPPDETICSRASINGGRSWLMICHRISKSTE